jgi:hypothetical protein
MAANGLIRQRPLGVTIVVVLMWIQAFFSVVFGVVFLLARNERELIAQVDWSSGTIVAAGIVMIVVGVITALLAMALANGSNLVRLFVGFLTLLHFAGALYRLFAFEGTARIDAIVSAAISLAILYMLFGSRDANAFFSRP